MCTAVQSLLDLPVRHGAGRRRLDHAFRRGAATCYQEGGITSPDGHCRAFDERAAGTVFSNGLGIVVLKRLERRARRRRHDLRGHQGRGVNNDGAAKVSFTAPSVDGHAGVIAHGAGARRASIRRPISYVEAHGTGTPLGDPVEIAGLTQAFRAGGATETRLLRDRLGQDQHRPSRRGRRRHRPDQDGARAAPQDASPEPALHGAESRSSSSRTRRSSSTSLRPWQSPDGLAAPRRRQLVRRRRHERPRRARGGAGRRRAPSGARREQLLLLSARSALGPRRATSSAARPLAAHPAIALADVAYTLQVGRRRFDHRRALVAREPRRRDRAARHARSRASASRHRAAATSATGRVPVPGPGSAAREHGGGSTRPSPLFRAEVDECSAVLRAAARPRPARRALSGAGRRRARRADGSTQTAVTQPALFVDRVRAGAGCGRLGHRARRHDRPHPRRVRRRVPRGRLHARRRAAARRRTRAAHAGAARGGDARRARDAATPCASSCPTALEIAAENAPDLDRRLGRDGSDRGLRGAPAPNTSVAARRLATSHAFHSAMMDPILERFAEVVASTPRSRRRSRGLEPHRGLDHDASRPQDPAYWVEQLRQPVLLRRGRRAAARGSDARHPRGRAGTAAHGLSRKRVRPRSAASASSTLATARRPVQSLLLPAGALWIAGVTLRLGIAFHAAPRRRACRSRRYPFERKRYWVDPTTGTHGCRPAARAPAGDDDRPEDDCQQLRARVASRSGRRRRRSVDARPRPVLRPVGHGRARRSTPARVSRARPRFALPHPGAHCDPEDLRRQGLVPRPARGRSRRSTRSPPTSTASLPADAAPGAARAVGAALPTVPAPGERPPAATPGGVGGAPDRPAAGDHAPAARDAARRRAGAASTAPAARPAAAPATAGRRPQRPTYSRGRRAAGRTAFGPYRPPAKAPAGGLTPQQEHALESFVERYTQRTAGSKRFTAENRAHLADPALRRRLPPRCGRRSSTRSSPTRSAGSRLWDIDGNEYVDLTNGFGIDPVRPQPRLHPRGDRGAAAPGLRDRPADRPSPATCRGSSSAAMVGMERVAFCNTGSEAVTAAIRLARTVSGRDKIAMFAGAYHGIFDEVLVRPRGDGQLRSMPIAPGIPLGHGRERRRPRLRRAPRRSRFLKAHGSGARRRARRAGPEPPSGAAAASSSCTRSARLTERPGTALVFDEVVTGFRAHPGGAQALFGIRADLATYGKVVGGGLPIGLVAGRREYMDALDGGAWQYGDESYPEVGVTFFAGHVRPSSARPGGRTSRARTTSRTRGPSCSATLNLRTTEFVARAQRPRAKRRRAGARHALQLLVLLRLPDRRAPREPVLRVDARQGRARLGGTLLVPHDRPHATRTSTSSSRRSGRRIAEMQAARLPSRRRRAARCRSPARPRRRRPRGVVRARSGAPGQVPAGRGGCGSPWLTAIPTAAGRLRPVRAGGGSRGRVSRSPSRRPRCGPPRS